jgi:hypothetical protein
MSLLSTVTSGVIKRPHYILVHGMPGIGKTVFASKAPSPIFLCAEKGTHHINVDRLELTSFDQFLTAVSELRNTENKYKTVVIDTVDHLEPLIFAEVCKEKDKKSIEDIGFAKGYIYALEYWNKLIAGLEALREEKDLNVILLAHTEVKAHNDPQLPEPFDRYIVKLHHKAANLLIDRVECVLFANYFAHLEEKNGKARAYSDGTRLMFTEHRPAWQAKNRFELPFKLPLDWEDFDNACRVQKSQSPETVKAKIDELIKEVKDATLKEKIIAKLKEAGDNAKVLVAIENRLKTIVAV